ncbi:pyrroline-5-carboxylate reductase [Ferviditalea candida]|uniref:Pyrroline-5-carboxylate reductase n=1 Tax=Ferviditalea candida TaxID=3108399 RepID=A0ABU5ZFN4_9BACL|nr:pyrroline-5-carboxylate reductase [Paenibacillaceae bacterium T2]
MSLSLKSKQLCFIGAGSMAEAIVRGLLEQELVDPRQITMMNRQNADSLKVLESKYGIQTASEISLKRDLIASADILILAVKPKDADSALGEFRDLIREHQLLVSVIAGLSIDTIHELLKRNVPIVRTMPNTSSTIGCGATGMCFSTEVSGEQKETALSMFRSTGIVVEVAEQLLDTVTGLSGSGPAYIYYMMEAMMAAGIEGGLPEDAARELTLQTVLGAAQMVKMTGEQPSELRRKVTSPNGTTQAALEVMDRGGFSGVVRKAVLRAAERAKEMGEAIASSMKG